MHHVCTVPSEARRGHQNPKTGVIVGCEQPCGCWVSNLALLEQQSMSVTTEPSFQPPHVIFVQWYEHFHNSVFMIAVLPASSHSLYAVRRGPLLLGWSAFSLFKVAVCII